MPELVRTEFTDFLPECRLGQHLRHLDHPADYIRVGRPRFRRHVRAVARRLHRSPSPRPPHDEPAVRTRDIDPAPAAPGQTRSSTRRARSAPLLSRHPDDRVSRRVRPVPVEPLARRPRGHLHGLAIDVTAACRCGKLRDVDRTHSGGASGAATRAASVSSSRRGGHGLPPVGRWRLRAQQVLLDVAEPRPVPAPAPGRGSGRGGTLGRVLRRSRRHARRRHPAVAIDAQSSRLFMIIFLSLFNHDSINQITHRNIHIHRDTPRHGRIRLENAVRNTRMSDSGPGPSRGERHA